MDVGEWVGEWDDQAVQYRIHDGRHVIIKECQGTSLVDD